MFGSEGMRHGWQRNVLAVLGMLLASLFSGQAVVAQQAPPPPLAFDGHGLDGESVSTQASFAAVWAERASARWVDEHNAELSRGAAPGRVPIIGSLSLGNQGSQAVRDITVQAFRAKGYEPGRNVQFIFRYGEGQQNRLAQSAAELARVPVDLIITSSVADAAEAMRATTTIPIVFSTNTDPVSAGVVNSLERPGRNATGASANTRRLREKHLDYLRQVVPGATLIAVLVNPNGASALALDETKSVAEAMGPC